jgi:hypothetical protein
MKAINSFLSLLSISSFLVAGAAAGPIQNLDDSAIVNKTTCDGHTFIYRGLAGYGTLPSDFRDNLGDTVSPGSSIAISEWKAVNSSTYKATIFALPDRGW